MGFEIGRTICTDRSIIHNQAVRSAAHIGPGMAAPANGVTVDDLDPIDFQALFLYVTACTMSFTGGSSDPTLRLTVQRKIDLAALDTVDAAWEDAATFVAIAATLSAPVGVALGLLQQNLTAVRGTDSSWAVDPDTQAADEAMPGPVPQRLRIREKTSGGDRTGGSAAYTMTLVGRSNYHTGG